MEIQIVELRRALESEAASVAAQRRSSSQLAEIEAAFDAIDAEVAAGGDGVLADIAFHRAIAQATGNPYFVRTLDFLTQYLTAATRVTRANEARRLQFMRPFALSRERTPRRAIGKKAIGVLPRCQDVRRNFKRAFAARWNMLRFSETSGCT